MFVYKIQEEVHRFAVKNMQKAKSQTLTHSSLEKIEGIGQRKAVKLLAYFKTIRALSQANPDEIARVNGISARDAERVYLYFHPVNMESESVPSMKTEEE